jgi:hypothetical protein
MFTVFHDLSRIQVEIFKILIVKEKEKYCIDISNKRSSNTSSKNNSKKRMRKRKNNYKKYKTLGL